MKRRIITTTSLWTSCHKSQDPNLKTPAMGSKRPLHDTFRVVNYFKYLPNTIPSSYSLEKGRFHWNDNVGELKSRYLGGEVTFSLDCVFYIGPFGDK